MKDLLQGYSSFKSKYPVRKHPDRMVLDNQPWTYRMIYEKGEGREPIVFLTGLHGSTAIYFYLVEKLQKAGFKSLIVCVPRYPTPDDACAGLERFLDDLGFGKTPLHFFGIGLGGMILQLYTHYFPKKVKSLMLCNSFNSTRELCTMARAVASLPAEPNDNESGEAFPDLFDMISTVATSVMDTAVAFAPLLGTVGDLGGDFVPQSVTSAILASSLPSGAMTKMEKQTLDFVDWDIKNNMDTNDVSSRFHYYFTGWDSYPIPKHIPVLLIQGESQQLVPELTRKNLENEYSYGQIAIIKQELGGGDFPILSGVSEVCLHMIVHLRSCGNWSSEIMHTDFMSSSEEEGVCFDAKAEAASQPKVSQRPPSTLKPNSTTNPSKPSNLLDNLKETGTGFLTPFADMVAKSLADRTTVTQESKPKPTESKGGSFRNRNSPETFEDDML